MEFICKSIIRSSSLYVKGVRRAGGPVERCWCSWARKVGAAGPGLTTRQLAEHVKRHVR